MQEIGSHGLNEEVKPKTKICRGETKVRHPMWRFSGPEFHISKLKIYHEKTQMEGKVRKNAQFFVGGQRRYSMFS